MSVGSGKYDDVCEILSLEFNADMVVLAIAGGDRGSGFSLVTKDPENLPAIVQAIRRVADQIEADIEF